MSSLFHYTCLYHIYGDYLKKYNVQSLFNPVSEHRKSDLVVCSDDLPVETFVLIQ